MDAELDGEGDEGGIGFERAAGVGDARLQRRDRLLRQHAQFLRRAVPAHRLRPDRPVHHGQRRGPDGIV